MPAAGRQTPKWVLKIVPVVGGYDVYSELPVLAFRGHVQTLEEAEAIAARQPTREEAVKMLRTAS